MKSVPIDIANELSDGGVAWRDVVQEIARATGRRFTADGVATGCGRHPNEDGDCEDCDLLSADRRVGASQNSLPRFHQRDPAVALPNFDITTMRKICHLLFCIIVVNAA
jgi:hypothetical protein